MILNIQLKDVRKGDKLVGYYTDFEQKVFEDWANTPIYIKSIKEGVVYYTHKSSEKIYNYGLSLLDNTIFKVIRNNLRTDWWS